MYIIKRNGTEVEYDRNKIISAISRANLDVDIKDRMLDSEIESITMRIEKYLEGCKRTCNVEEIQDKVINTLLDYNFNKVGIEFALFRSKHSQMRSQGTLYSRILSMIDNKNQETIEENSNKNPVIASTQRDYIAGETSKEISAEMLLPKNIIDAHNKGIIHFHDMDYFVQKIPNCCLVNLNDMLQNGTVISETLIEKPHRFTTAMNIATQIIAQVASAQYGGQTISLAHLSPFIKESYKEWKRLLPDASDETIKMLVHRDVVSGVQTMQYQIVTLLTTNGQTPFVTINADIHEVPAGPEREDLAALIEEVFKQRIKGLQNRCGHWITPAFPKIIYYLNEDNISPDSKYYYLTELAAQCTAARMVPDYISEKVQLELKGDTYPCMGCRSFLTPDRFSDKGLGNFYKAGDYIEGAKKYYGRFNQGVVTLNLVDVALESKQVKDDFWKIMEDRTENLVHRALRLRHERLSTVKANVSPILFQFGAIARLNADESIKPLLMHGYSTISFGYAGLYECVKYMTGYSHTSKEGHDFAIQVMQYMNDKCAKWRDEEDIDYSIYGTPLESTTYKFAKALQNRFGIIPGITDKNYITNSYHVNVRENINAFDKLSFEAEFQRLSPGGAISYIEVPDMKDNIPAVLAVLKHIYNTTIYAELNTKSDYCQKCGYDGQIEIVEKDSKLFWRCPQCGNTDQSTMNIARRTCGYIGTNYWNQGRTQEIKDRVLHL